MQKLYSKIEDLNLLFDGNAKLVGVTPDLSNRLIGIDFRFLREPGDGSYEESGVYKIVLQAVKRIGIYPNRGSSLPLELTSISAPTEKLISLLLGLFRNVNIFEWSVFCPAERVNLDDEPNGLNLFLGDEKQSVEGCVSFYSNHSIPVQVYIFYGDLSFTNPQHRQIDYHELAAEAETFSSSENDLVRYELF